jgi:hypothetical protein
MAGYVELFIDQGATFNSIINLADDLTNTNLNIDSYIVTGQLRRSYYSANASANLFCYVSDAANGQISISLTAGQTANLKPGRYVFDVMAGTPANAVNRIIEGIITVSPGVTR